MGERALGARELLGEHGRDARATSRALRSGGELGEEVFGVGEVELALGELGVGDVHLAAGLEHLEELTALLDVLLGGADAAGAVAGGVDLRFGEVTEGGGLEVNEGEGERFAGADADVDAVEEVLGGFDAVFGGDLDRAMLN